MKAIIITGASGNLGTAVTKLFLNKGYQVIATVANANARDTFYTHERLDTRLVDLSSEYAASEFVQSVIQKYGQIHAALLLVGGFAAGNIAATSGANISGQLTINFDTAYFVARPAFQHMMQNKTGRIIFIGARPALVAAQGKGMLAYSLSKSLLFKLSEFLNEEAKGTDVTATVVVPSTLDTPINRKSMPQADPKDWVKPEQVAEVLEFIVSEKGAPLKEAVVKVYNNA